MKLLKALTTLSLVFALFTLHVETHAIGWSSAYSLDQQQDSQTETIDAANAGGGGDLSSTPATATPTAATLDYRNSEKKMGSMSMAQMMTMLALMIGPTIIVACPNAISSKIFGVGAAIYLVMEIMNYSSYKKASTSNQDMYATLDPNTADAQIEAFNAAIKQEQTASKALGKKASAINIFFMAMTASAIAAVLEGLPWTMEYMSKCTGPDVPAATMNDSNLKIPPQNGESLMQYYARTDEFNDYVFGHSYQSPVTKDFEWSDQLMAKSIPVVEQNRVALFMYQAAQKVGSLLINSAHAKESEKIHSSVLSPMGIGGAAVGALLAFKLTAGTGIKKLIETSAYTRAAAFGVLAGFAMVAKGEVKKAKSQVESNIHVYENLRDQLGRAINGSSRFAGMNGATTGVRTTIKGAGADRDDYEPIPEGSLCLVGNAGEQRIDEQCQCAKNNSCAKADFKGVDFSKMGLPSSFGSSLGTLGSGANSLFSGNTQGANSAFGSLGSNAANLRKLQEKVKAKANEFLKKNKAKVSMEDLENRAKGVLEKEAPGIFKSLSPQQQTALGNISGSNFGSTGAVSDDILAKAKEGKTSEVLASIQGALGKAAANKGASPFKFDFADDATAATDAQQVAGLSQGEALGDFITNESDISDRPNENIFKIITVRYFKSAYPRFFDEESKPQTLE